MKRTLLFCLLCVLAISGTSVFAATIDPADRFLDAYFLVQDGDAAERQGDWTKADLKFTAASAILRELKDKWPQWNPHIIAFRLQYCDDHIATAKPKLTSPSPLAPSSGAEPASAPAQPERIQAANAELQQAREQIRQLEAARDDLNTKLREALAKVQPAQTDGRIEELLKQNRELAAQLAASQTKLAEAREAAAAQPPATEPAIVGQLRAELATVRAELQQAKTELQQTRQSLDTAKTDNEKLRRSYDEVVSQLQDANKRLTVAQQAGTQSDETIRQLRKENALLRLIADSKASSSVPPAATAAPSVPDLRSSQSRQTQTQVVAQAKTEGDRSKLVATIKAPPPPPAAKPSVEAKKAPASKPGTAQKPTEAEKAAAEIRALLNEARAAAALKDLNTAAARYEAVLAKEPDQPAALTGLGTIRYQQGRLDDASVLLRKAVAQTPNDAASRAVLGIICFRKGQVEDAFSELTRAVALDPRNAEAHNYLGIVMLTKGWLASAQQEMQRSVELNPQYADAHFNLAVLYAKQRPPRLELARSHYQRARELGAEPDQQLEASLNPTAVPSVETPKVEKPSKP